MSSQLLLERTTSSDDVVRGRVAAIIARVRRDGDAALRAMALEFDGVALDALEVPRARWDARARRARSPLRRAMERAARNIETAHAAFRPDAQEVETEPGVIVGRRPDPLGARRRVRAGRARGVSEQRADGRGAGARRRRRRDRPLLAAAALTVRRRRSCSPPRRSPGCDRVFALGGAGAIAAMAYGTASVPRVDRIVGPGNAYVAEAKLQVVGRVAIDSPAGPSELLVIGDATADPRTRRARAGRAGRARPRRVRARDRDRRRVDGARDRRGARRGARHRAAAGDRRRGARRARRGARAPTARARRSRSPTSIAAEHLLLACDEPRRGAAAAAQRGHGVRRRDELGRVRRLHDRREPRAPHRRARALRTPGCRRSTSCAGRRTSASIATRPRDSPPTSASSPTPRGCPATPRPRGHGAEHDAASNRQRHCLTFQRSHRRAAASAGCDLRASYRAIALYAPDRAPCRIDLSDNTNSGASPPRCRGADATRRCRR